MPSKEMGSWKCIESFLQNLREGFSIKLFTKIAGRFLLGFYEAGDVEGKNPKVTDERSKELSKSICAGV